MISQFHREESKQLLDGNRRLGPLLELEKPNEQDRK